MIINKFTVEEIDIIAMFLGSTRIQTISRIAAALPLMDADIAAIAVRAGKKIIEIEEREFAASSFTPTNEIDEVDEYE